MIQRRVACDEPGCGASLVIPPNVQRDVVARRLGLLGWRCGSREGRRHDLCPEHALTDPT